MHDRFASAPSGKLTSGHRRVLIVEDEPIIAFALEDILVELGHEVVAIASDVDTGIDLVHGASPDLVFLDVNLHGRKSYPVADVLEEMGLSYIFATGYGGEEHPERHRDAPTITKPYTAGQVKDAVAKLGR